MWSTQAAAERENSVRVTKQRPETRQAAHHARSATTEYWITAKVASGTGGSRDSRKANNKAVSFPIDSLFCLSVLLQGSSDASLPTTMHGFPSLG
jgi:hypothetical protein